MLRTLASESLSLVIRISLGATKCVLQPSSNKVVNSSIEQRFRFGDLRRTGRKVRVRHIPDLLAPIGVGLWHQRQISRRPVAVIAVKQREALPEVKRTVFAAKVHTLPQADGIRLAFDFARPVDVPESFAKGAVLLHNHSGTLGVLVAASWALGA